MQTENADIKIELEGATEAELHAGFLAAQAKLAEDDATPEEIFNAVGAIYYWDDAGFDPALDPSANDWRLHNLWWAANLAAVDACCANWTTKPFMKWILDFNEPRSEVIGRIQLMSGDGEEPRIVEKPFSDAEANDIIARVVAFQNSQVSELEDVGLLQ